MLGHCGAKGVGRWGKGCLRHPSCDSNGKKGYEKNHILLFAGAGAWDFGNGLYSAAAKGASETACAGGAAATGAERHNEF